MNDRFIRACRRESVDRTPIWLMRQAGRYLPAYRRLREKHDVLTICKTPELAAEVTLLPVRMFELDAAILFSDIMLPIEAMGVKLKVEDAGPMIAKPITSLDEVRTLSTVKPEEDLWFALEAIRKVNGELNGSIPLIGFCGAPFTLASYLIEGGPSRNFTKTKLVMYGKRDVWNRLMSGLTEMLVEYLKAQVTAGVEAVQLFDSWVGCLSPEDYTRYVMPWSAKVFSSLSDLRVPKIHFGTGTGALLNLMRKAGGDVMGIDWRVPLDVAWRSIGDDLAVQGNLDPAVLLAGPSLIREKAREVLRRANGREGHIFNLGHGVLADTPFENVELLVKMVHEYSSRAA